MKIGILSDTHDQITYLEQAIERLKQASVDLVFHCGDWVSPFVLHSFRALKCPVRGVFGNNDGDKFRHLMRAQEYGLDILYEDRFISTEVDGKRFAVFHGDYPEIVEALIHCGSYDVVLSGHNHKKEIKSFGKTLFINPGSLMTQTGPSVAVPSFALYDTASHQAQFVELLSLDH